MATGRDAIVNPTRVASLVKERALQLGFQSCGITDVSPPPHAAQLAEWLETGMAGTMTYMHRQEVRRREPARILKGATRVVVVTRNYGSPDPPARPGAGLVAKYARGRDYHEALRQPLEQLAATIKELGGPNTVARSFIDAGPVPERELGQRAGLGWIGKNTMLIEPKAGSFFFIGSVFTDTDMPIDLPFEADRCGTCRRCLDACPTGAFPRERVLDSRLCVSYLTIEHRSDIPPSLARVMDDMVFGCDICQDVCPWNHKFAEDASDPALEQDAALATVDLNLLSEIGDDEFDRRFGWTALARPAAAGMRRNARIAQDNEKEVCPA